MFLKDFGGRERRSGVATSLFVCVKFVEACARNEQIRCDTFAQMFTAVEFNLEICSPPARLTRRHATVSGQFSARNSTKPWSWPCPMTFRLPTCSPSRWRNVRAKPEVTCLALIVDAVTTSLMFTHNWNVQTTRCWMRRYTDDTVAPLSTKFRTCSCRYTKSSSSSSTPTPVSQIPDSMRPSTSSMLVSKKFFSGSARDRTGDLSRVRRAW